jgi:hypothetical protein
MLDLILTVAAFATIAIILLGIVAVGQQFGIMVMAVAVALLYLLYFAMQRRGSSYLDTGDVFGAGPPRLPPPEKPQLPRPGPPQIGRGQHRVLPGPKK